MNDVARTLATIDRAVAEWESWTKSATVADHSREILAPPSRPWKRKWLAHLIRKEQRP